MPIGNLFFGFGGRIGRGKYWASAVALAVCFAFASALIFPYADPYYGYAFVDVETLGAAFIGFCFVALATMVSGLAITVKRLHDRDKSGWWSIPFWAFPLLVGTVGEFAPPTGFFGILVLFAALGAVVWGAVELGSIRGTAGPNKYGSDPLKVMRAYPGQAHGEYVAEPPVSTGTPAANGRIEPTLHPSEPGSAPTQPASFASSSAPAPPVQPVAANSISDGILDGGTRLIVRIALWVILGFAVVVVLYIAFILLIVARVDDGGESEIDSRPRSQGLPALEAPLMSATGVRDCTGCPEMIPIPSGRFEMGSQPEEFGRSPSEAPAHEVDVGAFMVGRFEVTSAEFAMFEAEMGSVRQCEFTGPDEVRGNHPAFCLTWADAVAYTNWLSERTGHPYRLLTEAEWEYVARASTTTAFWFGDIGNGVCRYGNVQDLDRAAVTDTPYYIDCLDGHAELATVGYYPANAFGLHDTIGNVMEWVQDCYEPNYVGAPMDGSAREEKGCSTRVARGGSYASEDDGSRSASRYSREPDFWASYLGFRVARDIE